jgi:hypothetical protein
MADVDEIAALLLEQAKRFYEKATEAKDTDSQVAYLHASLLLGVSSLEAHVNSICDDFLVRPELNILERSILAEREYRLEGGEFILLEALKMYRLTERIEFLFRRFSEKPVDKIAGWWPATKAALFIRNELTHPKRRPEITTESVKRALSGIIDALDAIYRAIYKKGYPAAKRQLQSTLTF